MNLPDLIKQMKEKGLVSVAPLKFVGKAKPALEMLAIMADTDPDETDPDWWTVRLWLKRN